MPAPSTVSAQNINNEIGYSSTASVNLNETRVRNLACKSSGAISFGDCRWGINFPARAHGYLLSSANYAVSNQLDLSADHLTFAPDDASSAVELQIQSGGTLRMYAAGGFQSQTRDITWLTSGAAGDYTAQLQITSGDTPTGSATGVDLALSTTRTWTLTATTTFPSLVIKSCSGNLIIKDGNGTLITRPFSMSATAEEQI